MLRYYNGQEYKPHFDVFFHEAGIDNGGNRLATVLMYLSDVEAGGETGEAPAGATCSLTRPQRTEAPQLTVFCTLPCCP